MFKGTCYTRQRRGFFIIRFSQSFIPKRFLTPAPFSFHKADSACPKNWLTVAARGSLYLNKAAVFDALFMDTKISFKPALRRLQ